MFILELMLYVAAIGLLGNNLLALLTVAIVQLCIRRCVQHLVKRNLCQTSMLDERFL